MGLKEAAVAKTNELSDYRKLELNERIHEIYADIPMTTQRLVNLAAEMKLISADILNALPSDFERRKLILLFAKFLGNRIEYCQVKRDRDPVVTRIEMLVPCGLHNNIRIPGTLLTQLRADCTLAQKNYQVKSWRKQ